MTVAQNIIIVECYGNVPHRNVLFYTTKVVDNTHLNGMCTSKINFTPSCPAPHPLPSFTRPQIRPFARTILPQLLRVRLLVCWARTLGQCNHQVAATSSTRCCTALLHVPGPPSIVKYVVRLYIRMVIFGLRRALPRITMVMPVPDLSLSASSCVSASAWEILTVYRHHRPLPAPPPNVLTASTWMSIHQIYNIP